jgi:ribosome-associated toxin RatA of RatAB toxin-antitoxin module
MTMIEKSALVRFPAASMFALVDDIESYPEFLPWCRSGRVLRREGAVVEAELEIARGGFHKSFATRNIQSGREEIRMTLLRGPFSHLEGVWRFLPLREDASKISLEIDFELSGKLADLAFGAVFNQICNTLVGAFTQRAKALYGTAE